MKALSTALIAMLAVAACSKAEVTPAEQNDALAREVTEANMKSGTAGPAIDTAFVTDAIQGDAAEVAIGELAQSQGGSQKVKDFGKMLVADHGSHRQQLAALAQTAAIAVPDELTPDGKSNHDKLKTLSGDDFDRQFKATMIEDHRKDIAKYEKQAQSPDAATADIASKTLPTLRKHLATANAL